MRQGSGTIIYFDNKTDDKELWTEELFENNRVPNVGEEVIILDCQTSVPNRKEGDYTWRKYKVVNVITHVLISRGWDVFRHQYSVMLEKIEEID